MEKGLFFFQEFFGGEKNLENYNIISPIDGTVLTKTYKAGDTIGNGQNSVVLMSVVDMSAVKCFP